LNVFGADAAAAEAQIVSETQGESMRPKHWMTCIACLFASPISAQLSSRADSQRLAVALAHAVLAAPSIPGNQSLGHFVIDTLAPGWNPLVAAVVREERPGALLDQSDSSAAYAVRLDIGRAPGEKIIMTALWSLCDQQFHRESGRFLRFDGVPDGSTWQFTQERSALLGSGICSYGLNRRAR
jgi:hypothetical protein